MRRALLPIFGLMILLVSVWCSDSPVKTDNNTQILYSDWAIIDTSQYLLAGSNNGYPAEFFLDGDKVTGEQFTDLNDNGIYDRGTDIFIRCACDSNQDLNFNGQYDGPDGPWSPGVPYDDMNNNGEYDYPNHQYDKGEPFCDVNRNGVKDITLLTNFLAVAKWQKTYIDESDTIYALRPIDSCWNFESDSGYTYWWPSFDRYGYFGFQFPHYRIHNDPTGLYYLSDAPFLEPFRFDILKRVGEMTGESRVITYVAQDTLQLSFRKLITIGESYTVEGITHTDLLKIRFDEPFSDNPYLMNRYEDGWLEFCFSRELGLVSIVGRDVIDDDNQLLIKNYILNAIDSIPLPISRETISP